MSRRVLMGLLIVLGAVLALQQPAPTDWDALWDRITGGRRPLDRTARARTSLCYPLPADRWLVFPLPAWTDQVRIVTNADVPASAAGTDPERVWRYALDYRVEDDKGEAVAAGQYHHGARASLYRDPDTGRTEWPRFYLDRPDVPAMGKVVLLNLQGFALEGRVQRIRLRLAAADRELNSVVVRVYNPEYNPERELGYLWGRLSPNLRDRLSEGNVYPTAFLTAWEKKNLVRMLWRPAAPLGIEGRDYEVRTLYTLKDELPLAEQDSVLPAGLHVAPGKRVTVPVPEKGWRLRFEVERLEPGAPGPDLMGIRWYGRTVGDMRQWDVPLTGRVTEHEAFFEGGLLELRSSSLLVVRLYQGSGEERGEISPETLYLRTYACGPGAPVDYRVSHIDDLPTLFRVDARIPAQGEDGFEARLPWSFLGAGGEVLRQGEATARPVVSLYDRTLEESLESRLSEPVSLRFVVPAGVERIRVLASRTALISAYNRPPGLVKTTRVPEDAYAHTPEAEGEPTWFMVRPLGQDALFTTGRSVLLRVQRRPPERDPRLLQGLYEWERVEPRGDWRGRVLFTPRDGALPVREASLEAAFHRMPTDRSLRRTLASSKGLASVEPDLVYVGGDGGGRPLRVRVDGRLLGDARAYGTRGQIRLPPVSVGPHTLEIEAPKGVRVYMNALKAPRPERLLRFAYRLDPGGMRFAYAKQVAGEETISFRLFSPHGTSRRSTVRVQLRSLPSRPPGPFSRVSLPARRYDVRPRGGPPVPVLHTRRENVDAGETFFFPLGEDLAPGSYEVSLTLEEGPGGYVQVYRVLPGAHFDEQQWYLEEHEAVPVS